MESGKILHAPFQAFKFPATEVVQFRALVTPCHPKCEPTQCFANRFDGALMTARSYGKRRRRRAVSFKTEVEIYNFYKNSYST